jgi:hypothetical protein
MITLSSRVHNVVQIEFELTQEEASLQRYIVLDQGALAENLFNETIRPGKYGTEVFP